MKRFWRWCRWEYWKRFPRYLPLAYQREIFSLSPYACRQVGQGSPMVVMRREVWDAGGYEEIAGAPLNREGEIWILKEWLREHPTWRPTGF
ncbi:MAG: hypothetical protein JNK90_07740 [Planctomycetaceae bacterium]|nr:hypothetical protein [Planctomycetaceae bacterium]MBN8604559.1 hypothetical protein [Planctomycetota bacterium]